MQSRKTKLLDDVDFDDGYRDTPEETNPKPKSPTVERFIRRVATSVGPVAFLLSSIFYVAVIVTCAVFASIDAAATWNEAASRALEKTPGFDEMTPDDYERRRNVQAGPIMMVIFLKVVWGTIGWVAALVAQAKRNEFAIPAINPEVMFGLGVLIWIYVLAWSLLCTVSFGILFAETHCPPDDDATCIWGRESWIAQTLISSVTSLVACVMLLIVDALRMVHAKLVKWVDEVDEAEEKGEKGGEA